MLRCCTKKVDMDMALLKKKNVTSREINVLHKEMLCHVQVVDL
jgi:hypothetical protein